MNVGDYVRTDNGIAKCIDIDKNNGDYVFDKSIFYELNGQRTHILYKYYLQDEIDDGMTISQNIIDLIEVGDYVNGCPILHKENNELVCGLLLRYKEENIQNVVTKEQFESMEYKVGD